MSWLGLVVLLFNVLGVGLVPVAPQDQGMMVCTALGMVRLGGQDDTAGTDASQSHTLVCSTCLPLLHGGADTPAPAAEAVPVLAWTSVHQAVQTAFTVAVGQRTGQPPSRAPPLA